MRQKLKHLLQIQEIDMKMLQLSRVRGERRKDLQQIEDLRRELKQQLNNKEGEIADLDKSITHLESRLSDIVERLKKLEAQQNLVKKVDEFGALTQEMALAAKERTITEQTLSELIEQRNLEEELLLKIQTGLAQSEETSILFEQELHTQIRTINAEGRQLQAERIHLVDLADPSLLNLYNRLLRNKGDRVLVPIEGRACSGCHIVLTAQHESLVRKGDNLALCEHCSRIHFWPEEQAMTEGGTTKRRRKKISNL